MTQTTLSAKPAATKKRAKPASDDDDDDAMSDAGQGSDDDFDSALSQTPPKKAKKPPAPKKGGSKPLADVENESVGNEGEPSKGSNVSEKYQKVSVLMIHSLLGLDMQS